MEIWKIIPSFPSYEASDIGRIRSKDRVVPQITRWGKLVDRKQGFMALNRAIFKPHRINL